MQKACCRALWALETASTSQVLWAALAVLLRISWRPFVGADGCGEVCAPVAQTLGRLAGRGLSLVCSAWRQGHFQTQAGDLFEAGVGVHE